MSLSQRLKGLRQARNMTQEQLAMAIGISRSALAGYESSGRKLEPDYETLSKIADLFGVSTDYLLGRIDVPVKPGGSINDLSLSDTVSVALSKAKGPYSDLHPETQERVLAALSFANKVIEDDKRSRGQAGKGGQPE